MCFDQRWTILTTGHRYKYIKKKRKKTGAKSIHQDAAWWF